MSAWIVIATVSVGTYAMRASMFVALGGRQLPAWTARPMSLVAPAAVAALVTSTLAVSHGELVVPPIAEVAAVVTGFAAVRRSGNVMHAIVAGLPVYWLLSVVTG